MSENKYKSEVEAIDDFVKRYDILKQEIGKVIVGQDEVIKSVLISIFSRGHCLLVGVPGLAKTLLINTLADALGLSFTEYNYSRLMPSEHMGSEILNETKNFKLLKNLICQPYF